MATYRLKAARLTDLDPGSTIDDALGAAETAVAGLIGATLDIDYPGAIVSPSTHDHGTAGGVQVDHTKLSNIGTNTHATLDTFVASKAAAGGLCDLDGSTLVPLARIPATLTGKDADTLDTLHAASFERVANKGAANGYASLDGSTLVPLTQMPTGVERTANKGVASGYASLDGSVLVPLAQIPATLTGKDADTLDTLHATSFALAADKGAANGYAALDSNSRLEADHAPLATAETLTAGESVVLGDVCYLKSDGKYWKAKADAEATSGPVRLMMAGGTIAGGATGTFYKVCYATTGSWTTAAALYLSAATAGAITATAPSTAGQVVRLVGYANSATQVYFDPSSTWVVRA